MMFFFKLFSVAVSLVAVSTLVRPVLSQYLSSPENLKTTRFASIIAGDNSRYHYLLGLHYYNSGVNSGIDNAIACYIESLRRNPLDSFTWIAMARAYRDKGLDRHAEHAAKRAAYLSRNNADVLWESGVLLLGYNVSDAAALLRRYIYLLPEEQGDVYSLYRAVGLDPEFILYNLVPRGYLFYKDYFNYLMDNIMLPESADAWEAIKAFNPQKEDYLTYSNFLIAHGDLNKAGKIWDEFSVVFGLKTYGRQGGNLIWNSGFELSPENGGFDWRLGHAEGVKILIDRENRLTGSASLRVHFDGKSNPDVYIAKQIVPVENGGKYRIKAAIKTKDITTTNGVFFEILGYQCPNIAEKTVPVTGTSPWKEISIELVTPKDCKAIWLEFRREKSGKFDNRISGDVWIDSVSMEQIGGDNIRR